MKKAVLAMILTLIMTLGFSFSASAEEAVKGTPALKSAHLLAEGYEAMLDEPPVPVGISNKDLGVYDLEPTNAEKLTIDVGNGKGTVNLYVFRSATVEAGEKSPIIYFIHGGGYHSGNSLCWSRKFRA